MLEASSECERSLQIAISLIFVSRPSEVRVYGLISHRSEIRLVSAVAIRNFCSRFGQLWRTMQGKWVVATATCD